MELKLIDSRYEYNISRNSQRFFQIYSPHGRFEIEIWYIHKTPVIQLRAPNPSSVPRIVLGVSNGGKQVALSQCQEDSKL